MINNTKTRIVISMNHVDNACRFTERLKRFCKIAAGGGDAELLIRHNGEIKDCGYVAHDLNVISVHHEI